MIEAEDPPPPQNPTGNVKDDAVSLLNDEEQSKNDQQIEKNMLDGKYEKNVIECKKCHSLI